MITCEYINFGLWSIIKDCKKARKQKKSVYAGKTLSLATAPITRSSGVVKICNTLYVLEMYMLRQRRSLSIVNGMYQAQYVQLYMFVTYLKYTFSTSVCLDGSLQDFRSDYCKKRGIFIIPNRAVSIQGIPNSYHKVSYRVYKSYLLQLRRSIRLQK